MDTLPYKALKELIKHSPFKEIYEDRKRDVENAFNRMHPFGKGFTIVKNKLIMKKKKQEFLAELNQLILNYGIDKKVGLQHEVVADFIWNSIKALGNAIDVNELLVGDEEKDGQEALEISKRVNIIKESVKPVKKPEHAEETLSSGNGEHDVWELRHQQLKELQERIYQDNPLYEFVKHLVWATVQYACKLETKLKLPMIHQWMIQEHIELELGLRESLTHNPFVKQIKDGDERFIRFTPEEVVKYLNKHPDSNVKFTRETWLENGVKRWVFKGVEGIVITDDVRPNGYAIFSHTNHKGTEDWMID